MRVPEIHIHEDDWGMRNLYPIAAWPDADRDLRAAANFDDDDAGPDGPWRNLHVIEPPKVDFASAGFRLDDAARTLACLLPRVGRFIATATAGFDRSRSDPWGSYDDNAVCFGFDASCFVKLEPQGELVKGVWFEASSPDEARLYALRRAIEQLDGYAEAVVADYWANAGGRVRDRAFMDRYFDWLKASANDRN